MNVEIIGQKNISEKTISEVVDIIFSICKADPNFPLKDKVESIEFTIESMKRKIVKQGELFKKAKSMEQDITKRVAMLDGDNFVKKASILESLGSEI